MNESFDIRRLRRSRSDRIVAGVSGGIAEAVGIDPNIVRLLFVILCFFGGAGILLYVVAWVLLPDEGADRSIAQRMADNYHQR